MEKDLKCKTCLKLKNTGKFCTCKEVDDDLINSFVNVTMDDYFEACKPVRSSPSCDRSVEELLNDAQSTIITSRKDLLLDTDKAISESTGTKKKTTTESNSPKKTPLPEDDKSEQHSSHNMKSLGEYLGDFPGNRILKCFNKTVERRNRESHKKNVKKLPFTNLLRHAKPEIQSFIPVRSTASVDLSKRRKHREYLFDPVDMTHTPDPWLLAKPVIIRNKNYCMPDCPRRPEQRTGASIQTNVDVNDYDDEFKASEDEELIFEKVLRSFETDESRKIEMCGDEEEEPVINPTGTKPTSTRRTEIKIENSPLGCVKEKKLEPEVHFINDPKLYTFKPTIIGSSSLGDTASDNQGSVLRNKKHTSNLTKDNKIRKSGYASPDYFSQLD